MPFEISYEDKLVRVRFFGVVIAQDLIDLAVLADKIENDPVFVVNRLCDLTEASNLDLRFQDMIAYAQRRKGRSFANEFKSALVASEAIHIGFARMFQTLSEHPQVKIRIFPTDAAARAWLAEPA